MITFRSYIADLARADEGENMSTRKLGQLHASTYMFNRRRVFPN